MKEKELGFTFVGSVESSWEDLGFGHADDVLFVLSLVFCF